VLAAKRNSGILLTSAVNNEAEKYLEETGKTRVTIFGGAAALPDTVRTRMLRLAPRATHRVRDNGRLYGLDYLMIEVPIGTVPTALTPATYVVDSNFNFRRDTEEGLIDEGQFNYLHLVPYAILPLNKPASAQVNRDFLLNRIVALRNTNTTFNSSVAQAFMDAQASWGVNAVYLLAHAALESAWGTSAIARDKNNIYGYNAVDDSPYASAATFRSKEDCILWIGGYIRTTYLREGDWRYFGPNLVGMNVKYATDPMWGIKIANLMEQILPYAQYTETAAANNRGCVTSSTGLKLRSGPLIPTTGDNVLAVLSFGTEMRITSLHVNGSHNWLKVETPLGSGWVSGLYVELLTQPKSAVYISGWRSDPSLKLNVYAAAGATGTPKATLEFATVLTVEEMAMVGSTLWYRVSYPGSSGTNWVTGAQVAVQW
jgi:hypothetical protein